MKDFKKQSMAYQKAAYNHLYTLNARKKVNIY